MSMGWLASAYEYLGRNVESCALRERAFLGLKRLCRDEDRETLKSMMGLALVYNVLGRCHEANILGEKAVEAQQRIYGQELCTLDYRITVIEMHCRRERYDEVEPPAAINWEFNHKVFEGLDHPDTLPDAWNRSVIYDGQKIYEEAKSLYAEIIPR